MNESDQSAHSESLLEEALGDQAIPMQPMSSHQKSGATLNSSGSLPEPLPRTSIEPNGTRDGEWPQSPFHYWREETFIRTKWSADAAGKPGLQNYARAYEFRWSDIPGQQRCDMCEFSQMGENIDDPTFEADIQQWIDATQRQEAVTIRLFVSYLARTDSRYSVSLTRQAFEAIEKGFGLHPATSMNLVPVHGHTFTFSNRKESVLSTDESVWVVSHFEGIRSQDWAMSLRYDHQRQHTDAMVFATRNGTWLVGEAIDQLLMLHKSWKQFRVLPEVFLQCYLQCCWREVLKTERNVLILERRLGATRNWEKGEKIHEDWPQNVDVRQNTANLHNCLNNIAIERGRFGNAKQLWSELEKVKSCLGNAQTATNGSLTGTCELDEYATWTRTVLERVDHKQGVNRERAQIQADLLFSMVSQKDSREGISMAQSAFVFTFITALFLPCTVVASIFSMSMFDWQPESESGSYVSDKFWIYWAFSIPLTIIVMGGWYWWSLKGMKLWNRSSSEDNKDAQGLRARSRWVRFLRKRPKTKSG